MAVDDGQKPDLSAVQLDWIAQFCGVDRLALSIDGPAMDADALAMVPLPFPAMPLPDQVTPQPKPAPPAPQATKPPAARPPPAKPPPTTPHADKPAPPKPAPAPRPPATLKPHDLPPAPVPRLELPGPHYPTAGTPANVRRPHTAPAAPVPMIGPGLQAPIEDAAVPQPVSVGPPTVSTDASGHSVSYKKRSDGAVEFSRPRSNLREITFSGGGGKGNAYPGVLAGLEKNGAMADVKTVRGASAGAITAALASTGMSGDEFKEFNDTHDFQSLIASGVSLDALKDGYIAGVAGNPALGVVTAIGVEADKIRGKKASSDGEALTKAIRTAMRGTLGKKIEASLAKHPELLTDPALSAIVARIRDEHGKGPTFADLRALSKIIPGVKELAVAATRIPDTDAGSQESLVFDADTQPDMDVADAVHASAALPVVFNPVPLQTHDGKTAMYRDGGVTNNAPATYTTGFQRNVDPVPNEDSATFLFQGDYTDEVLGGKPSAPREGASGAQLPGESWKNRKFKEGGLGAKGAIENDLADYRLADTLSKHREALVEVPLTFTGNGRKWDERKGTTNFNWPQDEKADIRGEGEQAIDKFCDGRRHPQTATFRSEAQMLNSIADNDLAAMAAAGHPEAAAKTLEFRTKAKDVVKQLESVSADDQRATGELMEKLNGLAGFDTDRNDYLGRELNRSGKLDRLFEQAANDPDGFSTLGVTALNAGVRKNLQIRAEHFAYDLVRDAIQPLRVTCAKAETADGEAQMLAWTEAKLDRAQSFKDILAALAPAQQFYGDGHLESVGIVDRNALVLKLMHQYTEALRVKEF